MKLEGRGIAKEKFLIYLTIAVSLAAAMHYSVLHWTLITDPMPLAMREAAPIVIGADYADRLKEGDLLPYGLEEYPGSVSVYGPTYTMLTGALQAAFGSNPYVLHRISVALTLLFASLLIGALIWKRSGFHFGLLVAVWFYLIQIASLTVTAGPSALAVLFYVLGIAAILQFGPGRLGLFLAIAAGFLGLLTKPYASLVIPAALIYVYLFHSPRRALIAAGMTAVATVLLLILATALMPTYFHSVFQIHSAYATRIFDNLLSQSLVFSKLNFGLIVGFFAALPLSGYAIRKWEISSLWGTAPLVQPDIRFDRLLVLVASAVLFISLGWHGGAYLIYFNHLLLPPLLLAACGYLVKGTRVSFFVQVLLIVNIVLLIVWRPPLRADTKTNLSVMSQLMGKSALVDPVFAPYAQLFTKVELIDNGQTEYLVYYDQHHESRFSGRSANWQKELTAQIESGKYEMLFLAPQFSREALVDKGKLSESLKRHYELVRTIRMPIYFTHFRDWSLFGSGHAKVYLFQRRDTLNDDVIEQ